MKNLNATDRFPYFRTPLLVAFFLISICGVSQPDTVIISTEGRDSIFISSAPDTVISAEGRDSIFIADVTDSIPVKTKADSIADFAQAQLGSTYNYGSKNPKTGFDCSGFCYYVFSNNGVKVPRTSRSYGHYGVEVPLREARKGDVLLFRGTNPNDQTIGHIGIVISAEGETLRFIHSSSSRKHYGVTITEYHNSNYPTRFLRVKRIL
jgi:lipoprotein Spr